MPENIRWIRQEGGGARGGEYYHLDTGDSWMPVTSAALDSKNLPRDYTLYAVEASDSADWYCADYSSNQNNRHYTIRRYRHRDFPGQEPDDRRDYEKPDYRERQVAPRLGYDTILEQLHRTQTFKERQQVIEELHPEVRHLADACDSEFTKASPAVAQALDNLNKFLVSAAMLGSGGTRSVGNVKKYLQQAYEVEAVRRGLSAEVVEGDLRRRWSTGSYPPGEEDLEVSRQGLKQLGIGFGSPNFVLEGAETYSIWLEFPFTKYARPDLFILRGEHESAFNPDVRSFLNNYRQEFFEEVVDEWKQGYSSIFSDEIDPETSDVSAESIHSFTKGLAEHLKSGLVVESKEEPGKAGETLQQLKLYKSIFQQQESALLTWYTWNRQTPADIEILDEFDTSTESARRISEFVRNRA